MISNKDIYQRFSKKKKKKNLRKRKYQEPLFPRHYHIFHVSVPVSLPLLRP